MLAYILLAYHTLHLWCIWHTRFIVYSIEFIDGIDLIDLIDFYNFKYLILRNYLTNFNETYTHYRRECVEFIYQFSSDSKF